MSTLRPAGPHRVLIVDDSIAVGRFLTAVLSKDERPSAVGHALEPHQAHEMIKQRRPDVLTLDVQMPCMDGLTFLRKLMRLHPLPVVMVAPRDRHLSIVRRGGLLYCRLDDDEKRQGHRPSVDRLFLSVADALGQAAVGILLTGMGADGAHGLRTMRDAGAFTVVQDRESSAVWDMPGRAVELSAHDLQLSPSQIGPLISGALATSP